jgi:Xaa-Pro aminopeptidase
VKTTDEIELLKMACAMVDATYVDIVRTIRPGTRENELVAIAHDRLFCMGSEQAEPFLLQHGHGVGLSLWERRSFPSDVLARTRRSRSGMVFAPETWKGADDGSGAARIEEGVAPRFLHFSVGYQQLTGIRRPWLFNWKLQEVPRMPQLARFGDRTLLDQALQVAGCGRA